MHNAPVCTQILSFPVRKLIHFLIFSPFHRCSSNHISETCSPSSHSHCWAALLTSSDQNHSCPRLLQCHLLGQDGHSDCQRDDSDPARDLGRLPGRGKDDEAGIQAFLLEFSSTQFAFGSVRPKRGRLASPRPSSFLHIPLKRRDFCSPGAGRGGAEGTKTARVPHRCPLA